MHVVVESLFFIGSQLVALSRPPVGKIGVWHSMTQHWQIQDVTPVSSYDTAGSLLILGCSNGSICYIGNFIAFNSNKLNYNSFFSYRYAKIPVENER